MRFEYFNLLQLQGSRAWFVTSEPKQTEAVFQICTTLFIATLLFGMFILSNPNPNPNPDQGVDGIDTDIPSRAEVRVRVRVRVRVWVPLTLTPTRTPTPNP